MLFSCHCYSVQHAALPELLSGMNICLYGESGSGKTLAHALAVLQQVDPSVNEVVCASYLASTCLRGLHFPYLHA